MVAAYGRRRLARKAAGAALFAALPLTARAASIRLLALGDSLAAGYGLPRAEGFQAQLAAALHRAGTDVTMLDGAVSGDTSAGGLARLDWVLADHPNAAIVELGGNDGLRGLPVPQMQANIAAILDRLHAAHIPTLLTGMYPPPNLGADYTTAFRAAFDTLGRRPGIFYDPFFLQDVALHPELIQPDGIHPNAAGVAIIVARLLPAVRRLLRAASP